MTDWNNIILIIQIYQSALFALLAFLLYFRHGNYSKKYLGWFMVVSTFFAIYKGAYTPGFYHVFWYLFPIGVPLFLSFFPTFYFYIKSLIIKEYHFFPKEFYHLLPALLLFVLSLPLYFSAGHHSTTFDLHGTGIFDGLSFPLLRFMYYIFVYGYFNFQVIFYAVKIYRLYLNHKANIESSFSYTSTISLSWVIILTVMMVLFLALLDLSYLVGMNEHEKFHGWINMAVAGIILFLAVFGFLQKDIYPHHILETPAAPEPALPEPVRIEAEITDQETAECVIMQHAPGIAPPVEGCQEEDCCQVKKYAGSGLTERQKKLLVRKLEKLMKEKIYLNEKLSIDEVAEKLETNSKYLSQVINETHGQNFYTYINTYRVREAQRLLKDSKNQKYSIQGIARLAGFSSKSSFNEAFRRIIGMTPSQFAGQKEK